jgi:hypothetical protein
VIPSFKTNCYVSLPEIPRTPDRLKYKYNMMHSRQHWSCLTLLNFILTCRLDGFFVDVDSTANCDGLEEKKENNSNISNATSSAGVGQVVDAYT